MRDDDFMFGLCSDHDRIILESSVYWRKFSRQAQYLVKLEGGSCCSAHGAGRVLCDADHEIHFSRQAQYLVKLEDDTCGSTHCNGRFTCEKDRSSHHQSPFPRQARYLVKLEVLRALYWTFHVSCIVQGNTL